MSFSVHMNFKQNALLLSQRCIIRVKRKLGIPKLVNLNNKRDLNSSVDALFGNMRNEFAAPRTTN